jgi:hypothetical protein
MQPARLLMVKQNGLCFTCTMFMVPALQRLSLCAAEMDAWHRPTPYMCILYRTPDIPIMQDVAAIPHSQVRTTNSRLCFQTMQFQTSS